jgi:hypothetical protein
MDTREAPGALRFAPADLSTVAALLIVTVTLSAAS